MKLILDDSNIAYGVGGQTHIDRNFKRKYLTRFIVVTWYFIDVINLLNMSHIF